MNNTATVTPVDVPGRESDSSVTIPVSVPCVGCTLTQGYWKTHSSNGPAPYDDNWAGMEDDLFYPSGKTWYQVFWTPPAGNAYYSLAHQYMAAVLNISNGASSTTAVNEAIANAEAFFTGRDPSIRLSKSEKANATYLASILASYNEGSIGPGHCDE